MKATIVGAGIGGLTTALCLGQSGWDVVVLEQSDGFGQVGSGIQLSPNANRVLARLGVLNALRKRAFEPRALEMRRGRSGRSVFSLPLEPGAFGDDNVPYLSIHRADLHQVLLGALANLEKVEIRLASTVTGYRDSGGRATTELSDGQRISSDLLVGADGVHSVIRHTMLGEDSPRYTGNIAWRATVPVASIDNELLPPSACVWTGASRHAVTYRLGGEKLANFVGVVEQESWDSESWSALGSRKDALADFRNWHPGVTQMIEQAPRLYRWALLDRPPLARWGEGVVTLLGDACHPMLPFLAQGAAMAIEDAWALSDCLGLSATVEQANSHYFQRRLERTARVQAQARKNMRIFHRRNALTQFSTYAPMTIAARLVPKLVRSRLDWLYCYDVTKD